MWLLLLTRILIPAATAAEPSAVDAGRPMPEPIATRQMMFSIPFRVERGDPAATEPVGVQLQVSTDRGATWRVYSKVEPGLGRFLFRAGADGEYWFVVQTLDAQGHLRPPHPTAPGLCVVVDTAPPRIDLEAVRGEGGEITARWRVTELNPRPDSLRILYRTDPAQSWQSVAVDRGRIAVNGPVQSGDATWWPQGGGTQVEVRAELNDLAGNANVSHAQVRLQPAPPQGQNLTAMAGAVPQSAPAASPPPIAWQSAAQRPEQTAAAAPPTVPPTQTIPAGTPGPAGSGSPIPGPSGNPFRQNPAQMAHNPSGPPASGNAAYHTASLPAQPPSVAIQINPAVGNQFTPPGDSAGSAAGPTLGNGQPRMVNTTMFELEYTFESVGPSGVARVELWGTRDGGQTWSSFGLDDDKQSPMVARVPGEGVYGFRVAVQSGVGLGGEPPAAGTVPDLWIGVDLTKPEVRLLASKQSNGEEAGKLTVAWEARDRMLAPQPISLFYAQTPGGPWTPIAANLENTGQYAWSVPGAAPDAFYLRIEARDEAGNLGITELTEPVHLDRQRPNVRIQGIRPVPR